MHYTKKDLFQILNTLDTIPSIERGHFFNKVRSYIHKWYLSNRHERKDMFLKDGGSLVKEAFSIPYEELPLYINKNIGDKSYLSSSVFLELIKLRFKLGK